MTRILLVRHGETQWNREERFIGRTDIPLNSVGRRQGLAIAERLRTVKLEAIYSSDLQRAYETAGFIANYHDLKVQVDSRLREIDYEEWEGLTRDEIERRHRAHVPSIEEEPRVQFPSGAALESCRRDTRVLLDTILSNDIDRTVALVGHGVSFQVILYELLDIPFRNHWLLYMYNGSISEVYVHGVQAVLIRLNDTCHLT